MKRALCISLAVLLLAACAKEEFNEKASVSGPEFTASFENEETRTYVDSNLETRWTADDRISIFMTTYNAQYRFNGKTGDDSGTFSDVETSFYAGNGVPANYAVYPYKMETSITTSGTISLSLPDVQNYAADSYAPGSNTMVAVTENNFSKSLQFRSLGGFLEVKLYGKGSVKTISIRGNDGEKIAGDASVTPVYGKAPVVSVSESGTEKISIDCGSGVELGKTSDAATSFWFVIPPVTFNNGFRVIVKDTEGGIMVNKVSSSRTIERNVKVSMAATEVKFEKKNLVEFDDENFKAFCVKNFDTDEDDEISYSEAAAVEEIDCCFESVSSLKGIEYFTSLTDLNIFGNELTSLDVSKNTALEILSCGLNELTSLDVSMNTALKLLSCANNQLTSLTLGDNTELVRLLCNANRLIGLDVSGCTALEDLSCENNELTSLDVSKNPALDYLVCSPMPTLLTLYVAPGQMIPGVTDGHRSSDRIPFTTVILTAGEPLMVDLGLSVKWASFNVGAYKAEGYGDYYAWGDIETRSDCYDYTWEYYKHCDGSSFGITRYNTMSEYGTVDNKTVLDPEDDVALMKWGGSWRMPTYTEWSELMDNCTWTWTTLGGEYGMMVTSNKEGYTDRWIFLPSSDLCTPFLPPMVGFSGAYWSTSLDTSEPRCARPLFFTSDEIYMDSISRARGLTIRPVSE